MDQTGTAGTSHQAFQSPPAPPQFRDDNELRHRYNSTTTTLHTEQDAVLPAPPPPPPQPAPQPAVCVPAPPANAAPATVATTPTLWNYFKRGDKMQKTNKFEANCIFCLERQTVYTKTRGEKRMMSGHLRNCSNATPQARQEAQAVSQELKNRRASASRSRQSMNAAAQGANLNIRKRSKARLPPHAPVPLVGSSGAPATATAQGTGNNNYYQKDQHPNGFITNDGIRIYYEERGVGEPLVLIHGWSGTCKYFVRNFDSLSQNFRVIQFDLRGHGDSDKPPWGFHIHRLAVDLHQLITHLQLPRVAMLGCSMGCAIIWAFVELYGVDKITGALFVDQSPWQMVAPDGSWQFGSSRTFSESAIAHLAAKLELDRKSCHLENVRTCLNRDATETETEFFVNESMKANSEFLVKLIANHSNIDWRAMLQNVTCPALVIVGKRSKVFPWQGVAHAAEKMPNAKLITFDDAGHWLFYEEADKFNALVTAFLKGLTRSIPST